MSQIEKSAHAVATADGVTVSFDLYHQAGRTAVMVICHGFFQSKEAKMFQKLAPRLAEDRDVICMDFRGHGKSSGRFTFSSRENSDLTAVLDWVKARYPNIQVMGLSLGGAIAINTISQNPQGIDGLIAVSAPAAFEDIEFKFWTPEAIRTGVQGFGPGVGCRIGNLFLPKKRPVDQISRLKGMPLLFIHGTRDVIVGIRHGHRLFAAANEPKQFEIIQGGSHAHALFHDDPEGFLRIVAAWQGNLRISVKTTTPALG